MIPSALCLDANVFISAMNRQEESHVQSLALLQVIESQKITLYEPELLLFEIGTAYNRKIVTGELPENEAHSLLDFMFSLPILFQWQPFLLKEALSLTRKLGFRGISNCSYIALAMYRRIPLITLDQEIIQKGSRIYKSIYTAHDFLES